MNGIDESKHCNGIPDNNDSSTWDGASVNGKSASSPDVPNGTSAPTPAPPPPTPPTAPLIPPTKTGVIGGGRTPSNGNMPFSEAIHAAAKTEDEMDDNITNMDFLAESTVKKGFTGLENLGNTCYLNSIVQCLANTRPLRDYFLSKFLQQLLMFKLHNLLIDNFEFA